MEFGLVLWELIYIMLKEGKWAKLLHIVALFRCSIIISYFVIFLAMQFMKWSIAICVIACRIFIVWCKYVIVTSANIVSCDLLIPAVIFCAKFHTESSIIQAKNIQTSKDMLIKLSKIVWKIVKQLHMFQYKLQLSFKIHTFLP